jgi:hypothetical protein
MNKVKIFRDTISNIESKYADFLKADVFIISTALSKDFTKYGHTEAFVFIVTYTEGSVLTLESAAA